MVRRNFKRLDADDFLLIYKTYVRPHIILYSSVVTSSSEGHTSFGKCPKNSHQNGIQVKEITSHGYTDLEQQQLEQRLREESGEILSRPSRYSHYRKGGYGAFL